MRTERHLLDLLVCPACGGTLAIDPAAEVGPDGHVMEGKLGCAACQQAYPIVRGIPRFVTGETNATVEATVTGFGFQWNSGVKVLENTRFSAPETFLGFIHPPVARDDFADKVVLDVGCGAGHYTRCATEFGARVAVGLDLSDSVDVAFQTTRELPGVLIVQADIFNMPLRPAFDYAFSIGVLHHTKDPRQAFAAVSKVVKPGGAVSAWVYGRENNDWIIHILNPIRERITSRLPRPALLALAYTLAVPLFLALKFIYRPVGRVRMLNRLCRFLFYFDYLYFLSPFDFHTHAYVIFDHLMPALAAYIARDDFADWFAENRLRDVVITSRAGNSWRGYGVRVTG